MEELDKIINGLQETIKLCDLSISDEVLLEQGVRIFLTNKINESKKINTDYWNNKEPSFNNAYPIVNRIWKREEKPTEKQLKFLKKNKLKIPSTKKEATQIIKKFLDEEK